MSRRHRVVRASFYLSLALPLSALACGQAFSSAAGDAGDEGGGIILGDAGDGHDATTDAGSDTSHDAPADRTHPDGPGVPESGTETGTACPAGWLTCSDGGCEPEGPTNCGSCGNDCTTLPNVVNPQCSAGKCTFNCATGYSNCTSNPQAGCPTSITQQGNCGACNVTCSGGTPVCGGSGCVTGCDAGEMLCNGTCANTSSDPNHCGDCMTVCNSNPLHSQPTCSGGKCSFSCIAPDYQQCGQVCVLAQPVNGVTVAPGGDTGPSCGAPNDPCATITLGINRAGALAVSDIYVAEGTYQEQVTLAAGIQIHGGWVYASGTQQWSRSCAPDPSATVIQPPSGGDRVVIAKYAGSASIDTLKIDNNTTAVAGTSTTPGQSLYGIFAANGQAGQTVLNLTNVVISVASGGAGGAGSQGMDGGPPDSGCTTPGPTFAPGDAGTPGHGAPAGMPLVDGYHPSTGQNGWPGDPGSNGRAAPACGQLGGAQLVDSGYQVVNNDYTGNNQCCIQTGMGGTSCVMCTGSGMQYCGGDGTPGCGSPGSAGGSGGTGGGASIGVYVWNETVTITGASIATSGGGPGGDGGPGGFVYGGGAGAPGAPSSQLFSAGCVQTRVGANLVCEQSFSPLAGGGPGGQGYSGGVGGQGGGGSGGDSYCWFVNDGGAVNADPTTIAQCQPGPGGPGGNSGGGTSQGAHGASLPSP